MPRFAHRVDNVKASTIREILLLSAQSDIISFAGGLPAPSLFPVARIQEATQRVLADETRSALQYSTTAGDRELRTRLGSDGDPGDVLIVSGSQ
jgi:2-aminoadipate transaminase